MGRQCSGPPRVPAHRPAGPPARTVALGSPVLHRAVVKLVDLSHDLLRGASDPAATPAPADGPEPRGLILRPALLGFVAMLGRVHRHLDAELALQARDAGRLVLRRAVHDHPQPLGRLLLARRRLRRPPPVHAGLVGDDPSLPTSPGRLGLQVDVGVFALWSLPILVIAPLFSRDAYSYAAQGEMVSQHMNPYLYGPFELGNNSYTAPVDPLWGNAPAPYGPMFLQLDGFFARITFHNELATIVLLRLLALVGVLLIASCVPRLARLYHRDGAELFTLMVLNPVTIFHLIGGAHNDALMLGLLVAGLTAAKEKRPIIGVVLCALATAIKAPAAIGILYIGWSWLGSGVPTRDRIRPVVTAGLIGLGVLGFFSYVSGLGWGWVTILGTPGVVRSWTSPTTALALLVTGVAHVVHLGVGRRRRALGHPLPRAAGRSGSGDLAAAQQRPDRYPQGPRDHPAALRAARPGGPALVPLVGPDPAGPGGPRPAPLAGHRSLDGDRLHRAARRDSAARPAAPRGPAADRADPALVAGRPHRARSPPGTGVRPPRRRRGSQPPPSRRSARPEPTVGSLPAPGRVRAVRPTVRTVRACAGGRRRRATG